MDYSGITESFIKKAYDRDCSDRKDKEDKSNRVTIILKSYIMFKESLNKRLDEIILPKIYQDRDFKFEEIYNSLEKVLVSMMETSFTVLETKKNIPENYKLEPELNIEIKSEISPNEKIENVVVDETIENHLNDLTINDILNLSFTPSTYSNRSSQISKSIKRKKNISLIKTVSNHTGGMFFHPREIINDEILLTGGRDGIIKFWDIKNRKFDLINEVDTGTQWLTSLKHDAKYSHIYCSTYSKYLLIFEYIIDLNRLTHLKTFQMEGLHFIFGFDIINSDCFSLLACSGFSELSESVFIYQNISGQNINYVLNQAIVPLEKLDYITNKSKENYSKSLKFCNNLLIIGLQNGIIEVYKLSQYDKMAEFLYLINLSMTDFVFQIQIINTNGSTSLLASNANCLYSVSFNDKDYQINLKKNFLGAIVDFSWVNKTKAHNELVFIKLKIGLVIIYDIVKDEVIEDIDESMKKGRYDHCLIASGKENLLFSCRDNDILIYKY